MNNQNMIDTVTRISGVNPRKCMRCGKCSALRTASMSFAGSTFRGQRSTQAKQLRQV